MRIINIKLNDNKTVELSQEVVGYVEENKATQIIIKLNSELQSEEIDYHIVNFRHGQNDEKMVSQKIYKIESEDENPEAYRISDNIYMALPQYATRYPILYAQVEGHILKYNPSTERNEIDTIIKSPVFLMKLDESIVGEGGEFNNKVEGIFADMYELESKLQAAGPAIEKLVDGIQWEDIEEVTRPKIINSFGENSMVFGDTNTSQALGANSMTLGKDLIAYGDDTILVGKHGFATDGIIFAVANGTDQNPRTLFEVGEADASFYVKIYGVTPELTAAEHAIPTIKWVKDYLTMNGGTGGGSGSFDFSSVIDELRTDLSEGLDQVSNEVLEVRDTLQTQVYTNKPLVSNPLVLTENGWILNQDGKYTQTVLSNINASRRNEIDVEIESVEEWGRCFVLAVSEVSNGVVFEANKLPSKNLSFRITSTEVNYAV